MDELIFISYARTDEQFALQLAKDLRVAKFRVWMDQLDIRAGDIWDRQIEDALNKCTCFVIILSEKAVLSKSVMDKVSFAIEQNKKIIPVVHHICEIPFRIRRLQRCDCTGKYSDGLSKLVHSLKHETQPCDASDIDRNTTSHPGIGPLDNMSDAGAVSQCVTTDSRPAGDSAIDRAIEAN